MPRADLTAEIRERRELIAKMQAQIALGKEKDTARYRREKRHLARMLTVVRGMETGTMTPPQSAKRSSKTSA